VPALSAQKVVAQGATPLPPVNVEAPQQRSNRTPQTPRRDARRPSATSRAVARPAAAPVVAAAPIERANGPVNGIVATQSATGTKTDTPILETPQSVSVVTRQEIQQQGAETLVQATRYVSGVTGDLYGSGSVFDNEVKIRGFIAPRYLDGLRLPYDTTITFAQPRVELYGLERIEVLKGPSSGVYGQAAPGGILNMVSKRPTTTQRGEVELQTGSHDRIQGAFDVSGPLDKNREFLYRIVGLARDTDTFVDFNHDKRYFIAPSLTWAPTTDTSLTVLGSAQQDRRNGMVHAYLPAFGTLYANPNGRISANRSTGEPGFDRVKFDQAFVGYEFRHRFNEAVEFRQNLRVGHVEVDMFSMRNGSGLCPTMADPACYGFNPALFDPAQRVTARDANFVGGSTRNFTIDNQLQTNFATGWLQHKMLFGVDYQKTEIATDFRGSFLGFPLDVYNPVYGATPLPGKGQMLQYINSNSSQDQLGLYIQDQIKLDRWSLTLTGRHDRATANTTDNLARIVTPQEDSAFTGRVGLNYLFDNGLSPYFSYSTSFQPVAGTQLTGGTGQPFRPTTGEGLEAGVKFQPTGWKLLLTGSVFEINQKNVVVNTPQFIPFQIGGVRVRGVEADIRANVTERLDIIAGASHLIPIVTDHIDPRIVGKDQWAVNRDSAFLWAYYTFRDGPLAGLGFGGGARYTGSLWGDDLNTILIPSHTVFDGALSFDFSYLRQDLKGLHLRVNATNIMDKYYVANCSTGLPWCALGQPRTIMGTLSYRWNEAAQTSPLITKH